jgi:hypothetical protein
MDETTLICFGQIPSVGQHVVMMVIDFLSTASTADIKLKTSNRSLLNGCKSAWRFAIAEMISETLT